jgi:hypothetical protein
MWPYRIHPTSTKIQIQEGFIRAAMRFRRSTWRATARAFQREESYVRLYTLLNDDEPMLTVNADSSREAQNVLSALIGDSDLTVRRASPAEAGAWLQTASTADRSKMRRLKKTPTWGKETQPTGSISSFSCTGTNKPGERGHRGYRGVVRTSIDDRHTAARISCRRNINASMRGSNLQRF